MVDLYVVEAAKPGGERMTMLASHVKAAGEIKEAVPMRASVQAVDPDLFRLLMVVFHHKKTPRSYGGFPSG